MAQYISKSALVAEIKKEIKDIYAGREYVGIPSWEEREIDGLEKAIKILNTLEVKPIILNRSILPGLNLKRVQNFAHRKRSVQQLLEKGHSPNHLATMIE